MIGFGLMSRLREYTLIAIVGSIDRIQPVIYSKRKLHDDISLQQSKGGQLNLV